MVRSMSTILNVVGSFKHIVDGRNNEETRQEEVNMDVLDRVFCNCIV